MATQLVPLPEVERLSASVIRILAGNPGKFTLQGTNTYLVGRGPKRLLIDTGEGRPSWLAALRSVLTTEKATVQKALLTHWHHDHVNGVPDLLKVCPDVKIYKHQPDKGQLDIVDGQVFGVEGATLRALFTPGHTYDHMAFHLDEEEAMFTGDNVLGHGTAVFEELGTYLSSLESMYEQSKGKGYPGHGAVMEDCRAKIMEYIQHRKQREDEVVRVLKYGRTESPSRTPSPGVQSGTWTPIELVKVIYRDVPEELHLPASHGVIQVLLKLEKEGRANHDKQTGKWSINQERSAL